MKKVTFIIAPFLMLSFLTSCNNRISAPGRTININEAVDWVATHFDTRINLAKSSTIKLGLDNFKFDGLIYPSIYVDPVPIDDPTYVNLAINNRTFFNTTFSNINGVVGSFITENGYREDPIVGGGSEYFINYLLNPFLDSYEIGYIESLKEYTNKNAFETRYSLSGDNFYASYYCNDLANITEVITEASSIDPTRTFVLPFTGIGKVAMVFGFDKYGYLTEALFDVDSDYVNVHLGLTGGQINTTFFSGAMSGRMMVKNTVTLYEEKAYPHLKFREIGQDGNINPEPTYKTRGVTSQNEAHSVGTDYCDNIAVRLSPYYQMLLPGYGSNVVVDEAISKLSITYKGLSYVVYSTETNAHSASGVVEVKGNKIHFYPESFVLTTGDDVYVDIQLQGE